MLTGWTPHRFQVPSTYVSHPLHQLACVGPISPDPLQPGKPAYQTHQRQLSSVSILNIGRMHHHCQQQSCGVYYDASVRLRAFCQLNLLAISPRHTLHSGECLRMPQFPIGVGGCANYGEGGQHDNKEDKPNRDTCFLRCYGDFGFEARAGVRGGSGDRCER